MDSMNLEQKISIPCPSLPITAHYDIPKLLLNLQGRNWGQNAMEYRKL